MHFIKHFNIKTKTKVMVDVYLDGYFRSNENEKIEKYILPEYPLTEKLSENVYMSMINTKKYAIKFLNCNDQSLIKEIELIKFLNQSPGPRIVFNQRESQTINNKENKKNFYDIFCGIGYCTDDDAINDDAMKEELLEKELFIEHETMNDNNTFNSSHIYKYVTTIENDNMRYLITEYSGKDMFNFVSDNEQSFTERTIKIIFYQLVCAINKLHGLGFVHADLSLENICLHDQKNQSDRPKKEIDGIFNIKIIDIAFGMIHPNSPYYEIYKKNEKYEKVKIYNTNNIREFLTSIQKESFDSGNSYLGKILYMSPERMLSHTHDSLYCSYKDDTYALGIILYSLIFGLLPYKKPSKFDQNFRKIMSGKWKNNLKDCNYKSNHIKHKEYIGYKNVIDLIDRILKYETKRITTCDILDHPWFDDIRNMEYF